MDLVPSIFLLVPADLNATSYTNLTTKCRIAKEVAFLFYAAVSDFHSLSYGNYKQENRTENEQVWMRHFVVNLVLHLAVAHTMP